MTFPPKVALKVYTQHRQPQASQVQQQSFRKVTERNSSGQQLHISVGLPVSKTGERGDGGGRKEKKKEEKKTKGSRGREHSFPVCMHSQNTAESLATRNRTARTQAAGCGLGATTSCLRQDSRQPCLTCGLCAPGPPSASVPPEQLLPGPSPVKMESSSGPLRFCSKP